MPTPEYHAILSPSSAHRWINCPASMQMSQGIPSTTSKYAEAGRLAHSIAELKARKRFQVMTNRSFHSQLKKLKADEQYSSEMDSYTDLYVETLEQHAMTFKAPPFIALETSVPVGVFTQERKSDGSPATGTADCIQIGEGTLWITDYKNGAGVPVEADHNPQMMLYALGALNLYSVIYGCTIQIIKMTIVQPALKSVSDFKISRKELEDWGNQTVKPAAVKAASENPGEPIPGDWCKFCPAKYTCRERSNKVLAVEAFGKKLPPKLSDVEVGDALTRGAALVSWYNDLKEYALKACLGGKVIPGFKAVAGRSARGWDDLDKAFADLQLRGVAEAILWERKPTTVAGLEKAIGKKTFAEVSEGHVIVKPGKPTLVPESDERPAFDATAQAFKPIN